MACTKKYWNRHSWLLRSQSGNPLASVDLLLTDEGKKISLSIDNGKSDFDFSLEEMREFIAILQESVQVVDPQPLTGVPELFDPQPLTGVPKLFDPELKPSTEIPIDWGTTVKPKETF